MCYVSRRACTFWVIKKNIYKIIKRVQWLHNAHTIWTLTLYTLQHCMSGAFRGCTRRRCPRCTGILYNNIPYYIRICTTFQLYIFINRTSESFWCRCWAHTHPGPVRKIFFLFHIFSPPPPSLCVHRSVVYGNVSIGILYYICVCILMRV